MTLPSQVRKLLDPEIFKAPRTTGGSGRIRSLLDFSNRRILGVLTALAATFIFFTIMVPQFLNIDNLIELGVQSSIIAVIALGMTLVIVTGGIDLSVGSIVGLVSVICATNLPTWGIVPTIIIGLALGGVLGYLNGAFSAYFALESFVVTLAALNIYRGLAFLYTEGRPIFGVNDAFRDVFAANIGPIPKPIVLLVVVTIICFLILNRSKSGVHLKAVGTNADAARKSGVSVNRIKVLAFTLSGLTCGLGALMLVARIGAAEPISGTGYELTVIAAVVVGGTSLMGGRASIIGTVLGAILLGAIRTGLTLMNVNPFLQLVVTGAIILFAVLLDRAVSKTKVKH
jgi:ribose transport system permease protein